MKEKTFQLYYEYSIAFKQTNGALTTFRAEGASTVHGFSFACNGWHIVGVNIFRLKECINKIN
jgi:hypothetical protein